MDKKSMSKDTHFSPKTILAYQGKILDLSVPRIMGILNVTPDSFFDGGKYIQKQHIEERILSLLNEGADLLDVGACSTRPGADEVSEEEETERILHALEIIKAIAPDALVSVDTFRSSVAKKALEQGAFMINDISGGADPEMFKLVAEKNVPYVLMHIRGNAKTMQQLTDYTDVVEEVYAYFEEKLNQLVALGAAQVLIDPGFGFAKTVEQNYALFSKMARLQALGYPLLVGVSRKSMLCKLLQITPQEALNATTVLNTLALQQGVSVLRVHDVKEAKEVVTILSAL